MNIIRNQAAALGVLSALAIGFAAPASAGPLPTGTATVKTAVSDPLTEVQWRRGGRRGVGPGLAFGLAAGALAGAAIASQPYGYGGYGYYEEPVYAAPYGYAPMYEAPVSAYGYPPPAYGYSYSPGYSRSGNCTTDEGYGRRSAC